MEEYLTSLIMIVTDLVGLSDDPVSYMKEITDSLNANMKSLMESEEFLRSREEFLSD